jgi:hypothetical protein
LVAAADGRVGYDTPWLPRPLSAWETLLDDVFLACCACPQVTMTLVAHWMACLWYVIGYPDGWVMSEGIVDEEGVHIHGQAYLEWISSFYW